MTTTVEDRVRATLRAVADATSAATADAASPPYMDDRVRRTRPVRLLAAVAAAAAVVAFALVSAGPDGDGDRRPAPRGETTPAAAPDVAGPPGARLLAEGTVGTRRWALYGVDELAGASQAPDGSLETPCVVLKVEGDDHPPSGCGYGYKVDSVDGRARFAQIGPVAADGDEALLLAVFPPPIEKILIGIDGEAPREVAHVVDPAHPEGARYAVAVVKRGPTAVVVRGVTADGTTVEGATFNGDGPIGG